MRGPPAGATGPERKAQTEAARIELASDRLAKDLMVNPVKKANIVEITYSSRSPQVAATVLQKLQDLYLKSTSSCIACRALTSSLRARPNSTNNNYATQNDSFPAFSRA